LVDEALRDGCLFWWGITVPVLEEISGAEEKKVQILPVFQEKE
jgi:hypothetical protein